jgi:hypothetical protein
MRLRKRRRRPEQWVPEHEDDGYSGPARLVLGAEAVDVEVTLAGHLEPLDGRYHWYGRVTRNDTVDGAKRAGVTTVGLAIGDREPAEGRLAEHDAWGNLRVTGLGAPPFELEPVEVDVPAR